MTHCKAPGRRARVLITLAGLAAISAGWAGAAQAQVDTHSKAPIDITADRAEVSNKTCVAIWRGAAEAVQEKSHLRADTITIYSKPKARAADAAAPAAAGDAGQTACGGADRIVAEGHVYYMTPDQNARGDHAVYTQGDDLIVMTGDVVIVQGQNVARGDKLTINTSTHEATMVSSATGLGRPGRVRAVFYPDKDKDKDAGAPAPAGATAAKP